MKNTYKEYYESTKEQRRAAIVDFIKARQLDENGKRIKGAPDIKQEEILNALISYFPNYNPSLPAHDQTARVQLMLDLRAIKQDDRYPLIKTTRYIRILTGDEIITELKRQENRIRRSFARLNKYMKRAGLTEEDRLINYEDIEK